MDYELKKLNNEEIDRDKCETIIENIPKLIQKPDGKSILDFWINERLCTYDGMYIYFKKKEVDENTDSFTRSFLVPGLEPYEVSEEFFLKLKEQWKKEGCGYYIIF